MTRQTQRLDRHGRPLPDDNDVIPDGGRVLVALPFMDHLTLEMRRALGLIKDDDTDSKVSSVATVRALVRVMDEAPRDNYIRTLGDAWKSPLPEQPTSRPHLLTKAKRA